MLNNIINPALIVHYLQHSEFWKKGFKDGKLQHLWCGRLALGLQTLWALGHWAACPLASL